LTEQEAEDFVAGRVNPSTSSKGDKFYGVAVGRNPGVYEEWADAQEQLRGVKGPKYKKFPTRAEAEAFVRSGGRSSTPPKVVAGEPAVKKVRTSTGSIESAESAESMESTAYTAKRKTTCVYTDGSARGNGRQGAYAGVGVFFGDNDER
jgi:ribonuclease HI